MFKDEGLSPMMYKTNNNKEYTCDHFILVQYH